METLDTRLLSGLTGPPLGAAFCEIPLLRRRLLFDILVCFLIRSTSFLLVNYKFFGLIFG